MELDRMVPESERIQALHEILKMKPEYKNR